ncbi:MAG: transcriptional regulator [Rhodobacterales bacterium]|nr:MAG: transcriptional regulator [Rhodobacterales bacterium]
MSDALPPLTALRAFDAAARHMSFAKAAEELHVTPAALSFQIKSLEEHLGVPLFHRLTRAVALTEAGQALAPGARDGFETLTAAWRTARRLQDTSTLTITAGPAFTSKWLAPRLYDFAQSHPDIELRITAGLKILDLNRDEVDVAIRFGYGPDDGLFAQPLADEWLTPLMRPEMVEDYPTPHALLNAPLIHNTSDDFLKPRCDWPAWFRANGISQVPRIASVFSQPDHALDAALAGGGVVLGRRTFALEYLSDGRLIAPFNVALSTEGRFRLLCRKGTEDHPRIKAFREWLLAEIKKTGSVTDTLTLIPAAEAPQ